MSRLYSSLAGLAPGYYRCICNRLLDHSQLSAWKVRQNFTGFLSTVFDVHIFSYPSDSQKHYSKDQVLRCSLFNHPLHQRLKKDLTSIFAHSLRVFWPPTRSVLEHQLHRVRLDYPICGKDLGLPGPSIVSCKRGNPSHFARFFSSRFLELLGE